MQASDFIRGNKTPFVDQLTIVDMPKRQEPVIKEQKLIPRTASNQNVDNQSALPFLDKVSGNIYKIFFLLEICATVRYG